MLQPDPAIITVRHGLPPADHSDASDLVARCDEYEGLDLSLNLATEGTPDAAELSQYLYRENGELIGFLTIDGIREVEVSLGVDPGRRRQGIGRRLLDAARVECVGRGLTSWTLVIDDAAASGKTFVRAVGASYKSSEYRLELARNLVPATRVWDQTVELRQATVDDTELVTRIIASSFGDPIEETIDWVRRDLAKPNHRFDVARINGQPIGQIRTNSYGDVVYVTAFGVLPDFRGRGHGRQILDATVRRLVAEEWPSIRIEVATDNANALGLYQSSGFVLKTAYGYYHQAI
jgi:ribosomal protein S18 acetylase RimI-like enzyme